MTQTKSTELVKRVLGLLSGGCLRLVRQYRGSAARLSIVYFLRVSLSFESEILQLRNVAISLSANVGQTLGKPLLRLKLPKLS